MKSKKRRNREEGEGKSWLFSKEAVIAEVDLRTRWKLSHISNMIFIADVERAL